MVPFVKSNLIEASRRLCSDKLVKVSVTLTFLATTLFSIAHSFMGLERLFFENLSIAILSALAVIYLCITHKTKLVSWVVAISIYLGLTFQIQEHPEHLIQIGMSYPFVMIILASAGSFISASIMLVIVIITIGLLSVSTVLSTMPTEGLISGFFSIYLNLDVFSISSFVFIFALGGIFFTYTTFQIHQKIYINSFVDVTTGLPNRGLFEERLTLYFKQYRESLKRFHVMFIGADNFSQINDLFGHEVGDIVLNQIGQRLQKVSNEILHSDVEVFRFGGDEFVITLANYMPKNELDNFVIELKEKVGTSYEVADSEMYVPLSIGISTSGNSAKSANDLILFADLAMDSAKKSGSNEMQHHVNEVTDWDRRFIIHKHLSYALNNNELRAVYQPVYDISSLRLIGCEVLIRWNSEELGFVSPEEFISVAEVSGLINSIGQFVFDEAVAITKTLRSDGNRDLKVAVNVSPYQLKNKRFYDYVSKRLADNKDLIPSLELEITESSSFVNNIYSTQLLQKFRDMGLQLALDDYGTGSTSFMSLQHGAFSRIKLDKILLDRAMEDENNYLVYKAAVDSSLSLGLDITAEGVETHEQYQLIKKLGCTALQGYLFSKPLEKDDFIALYQNQNVFSLSNVS